MNSTEILTRNILSQCFFFLFSWSKILWLTLYLSLAMCQTGWCSLPQNLNKTKHQNHIWLETQLKTNSFNNYCNAHVLWLFQCLTKTETQTPPKTRKSHTHLRHAKSSTSCFENIAIKTSSKADPSKTKPPLPSHSNWPHQSYATCTFFQSIAKWGGADFKSQRRWKGGKIYKSIHNDISMTGCRRKKPIGVI